MDGGVSLAGASTFASWAIMRATCRTPESGLMLGNCSGSLSPPLMGLLLQTEM